MIKKLLLIIAFIFLIPSFALGKEIPVKIDALSKISTSDVHLQEGDSVHFRVLDDVYVNSNLYIKKGTEAVGVITSLVNNGFTCQEASIYAEQFRVKDISGKNVKLKGIVFKQGRNHGLFTQYWPEYTQFCPWFVSFLSNGFTFIRGGEAKILPEKDIYTLYLENNSNEDL